MNRINQLEGLRGLLAMWVVLVHLTPASGIEPESMGWFAPLFDEKIRVQIFCIMSGFVIFVMQAGNPERYLPYLTRRLKRIYPAYIFAFFLSIAFSGIAYEALTAADFASDRNAVRVELLRQSFENWPAHVGAHLTVTHGIIPEWLLPSGAYAFLGQGWNISTEVQFYVIAPLVFFLMHQPRRWLRLGFIVAAIVAWALLRHYPNKALISYYAVYFATGIVSYYVWKQNWSAARWLNPITVIAATVAIGSVDLAIAGWAFLFGFALMVRDQERRKDPVTVLLEHPVMMFLGTISYSLYLLHMIPLYGGMYLLNTLDLSQGGYFFALLVITYGLAIPMAYFAQRHVESSFYRSKTHGLHKAVVPGTGEVARTA